ncbi:MAG: hypothetical protein JST43_07130 [Bacteroidetes bacterium]|nr:hypothetical protein [Bacteroidota bacterium]MBS1539726.1 hypothetical protein [Bacteroidota bacterium]
MKMKPTSIFIALVALAVVACNKDSAKLSAAQTNASLLAGNSGANKIWSLVTITVSSGGNTMVFSATSSNQIPACELDNLFQFTNDPAQSYVHSEGATTCHAGDTNTVEKGSWAFTNDGKTLVVDTQDFITADQYNNTNGDEPYISLMLLGYNGPLTVSSITSTNMTLAYSLVGSSTTYNISLAFASK